MINEVQNLLDQYSKWLKDKTALRQVKDWVEITTPYIDRHNDYIQIYIKKSEDGYLITDDGYTINDLKQSGCDLDSKKRKDLLNITLNGFGVKLQGTDLVVNTSPENFALKKHNMVQAILSVNDLFYLAAPMVASLFLEDVTLWLDQNNIRYTPRVKFSGKSGYDHCFDFVIPGSKIYPERILQTINRPSKETAQSFAFSWVDTKEVRPLNSRAYAFLNDSDHAPVAAVKEALLNYGVKPILWSEKEKITKELIS